MVMPYGLLNRAVVPIPLVVPYSPAVPAKVVTSPVAITILRRVFLPESATYRFVPSVVMPYGLLNRAVVPIPSLVPYSPAVPATVVTSPGAITILLMVLLPESATYRFVPSVVMLKGLLKRAVIPIQQPIWHHHGWNKP